MPVIQLNVGLLIPDGKLDGTSDQGQAKGVVLSGVLKSRADGEVVSDIHGISVPGWTSNPYINIER